MEVKKILTHENPDLDAILSVLLLKLYGERDFPGIGQADIIYSSANRMPQGKSAEELEREGILTVDIGGGRFDTHPIPGQVYEDRSDRCATDLVAEHLGLLEDEQWAGLIEFVRQHDTSGRGIQSNDPIHHLMTISNIMAGFQILYEKIPARSQMIMEDGLRLLRLPQACFEGKAKQEEYNWKALIEEMAERFIACAGLNPSEPAPEHVCFINWHQRYREDPENAFSKDPLDKIVALPTLVQGLYYTSGGNKEEVWNTLRRYFEAVVAKETQWIEALADVGANAIKVKVRNKITIVGISSPNGLVIKAARFRLKADLLIYRDPNSGATSFLIKQNGPLRHFSLARLAAKIRVAECIEEKTRADHSSLGAVGMIYGWFLHQSEQLLIRGSLKATDFEPSLISLETLISLAVTEFDSLQKLPINYCPVDKCTKNACQFYELRLQNCENHRQECWRRKNETVAPLRNKYSDGNVSDFGEKLLRALNKGDERKL